MQKEMSKRKSQSARSKDRASGRTVFDRSGRAIWEWQTATGVFEKHISDEQLSELENSELRLLDTPPSAQVASYYQWRESSSMNSNQRKQQTEQTADGTFARLFKRLAGK